MPELQSRISESDQTSSAHTLPGLCPNAPGGVSVCSCCNLSSTGLGVRSRSTRFLETPANVSSSYTTVGTTADHRTALPGRRPSGPAPKYTPVHKYHTSSEPALTLSGTMLLPVACFEPQNISNRENNLTSYLCPWPCSVNDLTSQARLPRISPFRKAVVSKQGVRVTLQHVGISSAALPV